MEKPSFQFSILIVDDGDESRIPVSQYLLSHGYDVVAATTGDEALFYRSQENFDLVLSEIKLPGMTGLEVLGEIKKLYPGTAVMLFSAVEDPDSIIQSVSRYMGASGFLRKPCDPVVVEQAIAAVLRGESLVYADPVEPLPESQEIKVSNAQDHTSDTSGEKGSVLVVDDQVKERNAICQVLSEAGYFADATPNGQTALSKLAERSYGVMLLSYSIPGMIGLQVLREMTTKHPGTTVIVMDNGNNSKTRAIVMEQGAFGFLKKPFTAEILKETVSRAFPQKISFWDRM